MIHVAIILSNLAFFAWVISKAKRNHLIELDGCLWSPVYTNEGVTLIYKKVINNV